MGYTFYFLFFFFIPEVPAQLCPLWCNADDTCAHAECQECEFHCSGDVCINTLGPTQWLSDSIAECVTTFTDVSALKLLDIKGEEPFWSKYGQSGQPSRGENSPIFVDINNDGVLDFFQGSHRHQVELGESECPPGRFKPVSYRMTKLLKGLGELDYHGAVVVDLDNDGFLDILVVTGGGKGGLVKMDKIREVNSLWWGGDGIDHIDGNQTTVYHTENHQTESMKAGLGMASTRSRILYLLDVNGDGLLDIFTMADRLVTNEILPGILLINQGGRVWKEERSMMEYSSAMILTDVDGDGFANEFVISRHW